MKLRPCWTRSQALAAESVSAGLLLRPSQHQHQHPDQIRRAIAATTSASASLGIADRASVNRLTRLWVRRGRGRHRHSQLCVAWMLIALWVGSEVAAIQAALIAVEGSASAQYDRD